MIGLAVIAGVALYIGICWLIVRALKQRWAKALAILIVLAIPLWDWPIGYYSFNHQCSVASGIHVLLKHPRPDMVLIDASTGYRPEDLLRQGFSGVEYRTPTNTFERFIVDGNAVIKTTDTRPQSDISVEFTGHKLLPWNVVQSEIVARRLKDGQILAVQRSFLWGGTWWQTKAAPMLGNGGQCGTNGPSLIAAVARGLGS